MKKIVLKQKIIKFHQILWAESYGSRIYYFIFIQIVLHFFALPFSVICDYLGWGVENGPAQYFERNREHLNLYRYFFSMSLKYPLYETILNQVIPIRLLCLSPKICRTPWIPIVLPAIVFGLLHSYSIDYMFGGFLSGLLFGYIYYYSWIDKKCRFPFLPVYIVHGLNNFGGLILSLLLF